MHVPVRTPGSRLAVGVALLVLLSPCRLAAVQVAPSAGAYEESAVPDGATLHGRVTFEGPGPEPAELLITRDFEICGLGFRERREVDVSETGGLRTVVMFIVGIESGKPWPEAPDGYALDQQDCYFEPYIQVVPRGAELRIINSDPILHNIHGYELSDDRRRRTLFNLAQPETGVITHPLRTRRSRRVGIECDAHDFMLSWIFAAENPYTAVVDAEGKFSIPDVPPGTYTVGAWHPFLGIREQEVTVTAGGAIEIGFEFTAGS